MAWVKIVNALQMVMECWCRCDLSDICTQLCTHNVLLRGGLFTRMKLKEICISCNANSSGGVEITYVAEEQN